MWPGVLVTAAGPIFTGVTGKSDREPDPPLCRAVPAGVSQPGCPSQGVPAGAPYPKARLLGGQVCPCPLRFAGFLVWKACWGGWEPSFLGGPLWGEGRHGSGATEPWPLPPGETLASHSKNGGCCPGPRPCFVSAASRSSWRARVSAWTPTLPSGAGKTSFATRQRTLSEG